MSTPNAPFVGKVALVTGGARGIGAAIVKRLARDGATVAFTYATSQTSAQQLVETIQGEGGQALAISADVSDASAVTAAVDDVVKRFGRIDILVNNAGVLHWSPFETFTLSEFDQTFNVNVRSVFVATQAAVRHMGTGGRVINIGSCNARRVPETGGGAYAMSKSALVGLTRGLARDLAPRGITINNVEPGPTNTDMNPETGDHVQGLHDIMAIKRHARPDEIAAMVAYVAGPEAAMVTGTSLLIDGGYAI